MTPREVALAIVGVLGIVVAVMAMVFVLNETMRGLM